MCRKSDHSFAIGGPIIMEDKLFILISYPDSIRYINFSKGNCRFIYIIRTSSEIWNIIHQRLYSTNYNIMVVVEVSDGSCQISLEKQLPLKDILCCMYYLKSHFIKTSGRKQVWFLVKALKLVNLFGSLFLNHANI